jgi:hypothetical protein
MHGYTMITVIAGMGPIARKVRRLLLLVLIGVTIGAVITPLVVTEGALRITGRSQPDPQDAAAIAGGSLSNWESARIVTVDGVALEGWLFTPREPNGGGVILLHGVGADRNQMAQHARFLLRSGFTVLIPDSRGHGSSGGSVISYGIRESGDIRAWADWLFRERPIEGLYGLGMSMGAAILLQSLPLEPRFRAVVADCPFDTFEDVAYYRLEQASGLGTWAAWPVVQEGVLYSRLVYGIDLRKASPVAAVRSTQIPVLLIHGAADINIPPAESEAIHATNPQSTTLWLVPNATHVTSLAQAPQEYRRRVLDWFQSH